MHDMLEIIEIKNSRESEETPAGMEQVFSAIGSSAHGGGLFSFLFSGGHKVSSFSFEIVSVKSQLHFIITSSSSHLHMLESQMSAQYPHLIFSQTQDYAPNFLSLPHAAGYLTFTNSYYYPLKTYKDVKDLDILSGILGQLSKLSDKDGVAIQMRITPAGSGWQARASGIVTRGIEDPQNPGRFRSHPHARIIENKINLSGFVVSLKLITVSDSEENAKNLLNQTSGAFGVFSLGEGNSLVLKEPIFFQKKKFEKSFIDRSGEVTPKSMIFNTSELASLWHPPALGLSMIKNISWGRAVTTEPPDNLPMSTGKEEEDKLINFFGRCEFRNKTVTFGLKHDDRRRHLYIVGKTGVGKSTLIANMAINDMRNGEGVAVIDPHGDLSDVLLDYIPSYRINDVAYLNPSDTEYPFHLNPLEVSNPVYKEIVASGIVSIFYKLYHYSWGPRLEYILRNSILTLLFTPQTTLVNLPELLTNDNYRMKLVEKIPDHVLKNFWLNEFNKMDQKMKSEAISPILNKVGQFLSSQTIRTILGSPKSTINIENMMDEGKIIIVNLSQGKLGEDNSALLGAMMITKMQLAAMSRVYVDEGKRRDFYLYVDEFQNFATTSFIKILSEARKYRLNLSLANQYIGQIDEDVQKAIFGNAGSIVSFAVGGADARMLSREFGEKYKEEELVSLGNHQITLKIAIDNLTSSPFSATTLPLSRAKNMGREKVIRSSRERYCQKI